MRRRASCVTHRRRASFSARRGSRAAPGARARPSLGPIARPAFGESADEVYAKLETLKRDLNARDISFDWSRNGKLHDREVRFDNGWVVKIGRGLDIYHRPDSWISVAAADFGLRPCRQTKVDVFRNSEN